jgi:hypothetical protein
MIDSNKERPLFCSPVTNGCSRYVKIIDRKKGKITAQSRHIKNISAIRLIMKPIIIINLLRLFAVFDMATSFLSIQESECKNIFALRKNLKQKNAIFPINSVICFKYSGF